MAFAGYSSSCQTAQPPAMLRFAQALKGASPIVMLRQEGGKIVISLLQCRYGSVHLSTHPPTHTPNMFSWFPIYFPLKEPVRVAAGEPVEAHLWRCGANHKVRALETSPSCCSGSYPSWWR